MHGLLTHITSTLYDQTHDNLLLTACKGLLTEYLPMCEGVCLNGSLADTSMRDYMEQMNVNFFGAVAMTKGKP